MGRIQFVAAALLGATGLAFSQDEGAVCTALLEHGVSNVVSYTNDSDSIGVVVDNYCQETYSSLSKSKQQGFEATVKKLPVKLTNNRGSASETHALFCREYKNFTSSAVKTRYNAKDLYDKALDAWRNCVELALGGTRIKSTVSPEQRIVDFNLSTTRGQSTFTGVDTMNMTCQMDGNPVGATANVLLTANAKSMRCERTMVKAQLLSSVAEFYPPANVKVKTTTGDYRVDLYEMVDGPVAGRLQRIEASIADLAERIKSLGVDQTEAAALNVNSTYFTAAAPKHSCPPGTFVSALQAPDRVGGRFAVDALKTLRFTCTAVSSK